MSNSKPSNSRQGMAPWRGMAEVLAETAFFLIFGEATRDELYFLNKLSKAARASVALRGACTAL